MRIWARGQGGRSSITLSAPAEPLKSYYALTVEQKLLYIHHQQAILTANISFGLCAERRDVMHWDRQLISSCASPWTALFSIRAQHVPFSRERKYCMITQAQRQTGTVVIPPHKTKQTRTASYGKNRTRNETKQNRATEFVNQIYCRSKMRGGEEAQWWSRPGPGFNKRPEYTSLQFIRGRARCST